MMRPKLFLDTDICINIANGQISRRDWRRIQKHINDRYRYYISWVTWKELLIKLGRGSDKYFEKNKEPLQVLYAPARRRFLPYPFVFAPRTVLGIAVARQYDSKFPEERVLEEVLKAALAAPNKAALRKGVIAGRRKKVTQFDLDDFDRHENAPQREHAELLRGIREGRIDEPDRGKWAAWLLQPWGITPYMDQCQKLADALDAAYRFTLLLSRLAKDEGYDFRGHDTDWGDTLQLFYLCDESMHFLTKDSDFRSRTKDSPQSGRILTYKGLLGSSAPS